MLFRSVVGKYFKNSQDYFIIRISKLTAHHDRGESGFSNIILQKIIDILIPLGKVIISSEKTLPAFLQKYQLNIDPEDMHDLISYAKIIISDSQTMSAEAAVLGTPSIRYSSFAGRLSYLEELEHEYGLTFGYRPGEIKNMLGTIEELLKKSNLNEEWQIKRQNMLNKKIDVNEFMIWLIQKYPESISTLKENHYRP